MAYFQQFGKLLFFFFEVVFRNNVPKYEHIKKSFP